MATIIARSAESVHWYGMDGSPQYTVKAKDGSDRPTTLRDARKFNLVPSVTTILKVSAKPGLEAWKNEQLLLAALTLPRAPGETEKDFITRIVYDSKETAKKAAERGTRIHESIESWFCGETEVEHKVIAHVFHQEISKYFCVKENHPWIAELSFSHKLGFGGKIDLNCGVHLDSPCGIILDAKSKEFGADDKVEAFEEHLMQLAAYRNGMNLPKARCANVFVSSTHPGLVKIVEWSEEDLDRGWKMFRHLLEFWKLKNKYSIGENNENSVA